MAITELLMLNRTGDGSTEPVAIEAGEYMVAVSGPFDGCTAQIDLKLGEIPFAPITDAAMTTSGAIVIALPACTIRVTVSGAGGSTDVSSAIARLSTHVRGS